MIHALKIENDEIVIDVEQALMYDELAVIYKSDTSKEKEFAKKEFKYIYLLADQKGYCAKNALKPQEAHEHALVAAKLHKDYKPTKEVKQAIRFIKDNLNILPVEKLIDNAVATLNLTSDVVDKAKEDLYIFLGTENAKRDDIHGVQRILKDLVKQASEIPELVRTLIKLKNEWDIADKGVVIIRGGYEYKDSYDGDDDEQFTLSQQAEIIS